MRLLLDGMITVFIDLFPVAFAQPVNNIRLILVNLPFGQFEYGSYTMVNIVSVSLSILYDSHSYYRLTRTSFLHNTVAVACTLLAYQKMQRLKVTKDI